MQFENELAQQYQGNLDLGLASPTHSQEMRQKQFGALSYQYDFTVANNVDEDYLMELDKLSETVAISTKRQSRNH